MTTITNNNVKCATALAALQEVMDPEIGLNIVDLGLIYQLDFDEVEKIIFATLTLTTAYCPMGASIVDAARESLTLQFPGYTISVELTFNPPWSHERISDAGKEFLNK